MSKMYLLTGAAGFLGSHICEELLENGETVRALVLKGDPAAKYLPKQVEVVEGDLCDCASLETFFTVPDGVETICIHCASMVTVNPEYNQKLIDINVGGTEHMIAMCLAHPECKKMVYVSSTGAIPELPKGEKICEVERFDAESDKVVGWYSKSKAMATQKVLDAVREKHLNACVVHPSGILGPKDHAIGQVTGTILAIMGGKMPVGMDGSFNLCDVRDLAHGCVMAAKQGKTGECYILANEEVTLRQLCEMIQETCPCEVPKTYLPLDVAYEMAKKQEEEAKVTGKMPLMTTFSVYNLARNNTFDYSKAQRELDYHTRPYRETIRDMVGWITQSKSAGAKMH